MRILAITPHLLYDYLAGTVIEGLQKLDVELLCTDAGNNAINTITDEEFVAYYPTADYILAFTSSKQTPPPRFCLIDTVQGWQKTAYIDGSEVNPAFRLRYSDTLLHPLFLDKARWYFRRECMPEHQAQGVIPLPFGAVDADFGNHEHAEKDIDVLCGFPGGVGCGLRAEAVCAVREFAAEGYRVIASPVSDYFKHIARSWITVEAYGAGECNARAWQIMANKSAMFAQKYNIVIPNLEADRHYVEWSSGEELKAKIREWLADKNGLRELIDESYANLLQYHTSEARARYLLGHLTNL